MSTQSRKRARVACKPCRERKRKCDGDGTNPCGTCTEWGYDCYYEARRRTRISTRQEASDPQSTSPLTHDATKIGDNQVPATNVAFKGTEPDRGGLVQRLEANSGAAFVRKLGLKIDPAKAPRLSLFSWNIGARQLSTESGTISLSLPVVEITSLEHMRTLAQVYFDKVDPCYGFIDRQLFFGRLGQRWTLPPTFDVYDSVVAGVAALGCLFSQRNATATELHLVRTAVSSLNMYHLSGPPSIELLTGWILRTIYLRMTDSPHSTWIASCTLMHLVEASGLHPESHSVLPPSANCSTDIRIRIVGVARHLNVWTSFDLGLSRVSFQKEDLIALASPRLGDYTAEILGLLPVSVSLDPVKIKDGTDLTSILSKLLDGTHTQPPSVLAQCNLVLCVLRRVHTQNLDVSPSLAAKALALLQQGLECARAMVSECSPWHQVANVPFQIVCVLLVMDTRPSLAMLPQAVKTLSLIASTYDTGTMREAYSTARLLVMLHQQRRKDDLATFGEALDSLQPQESVNVLPSQENPSAEEYSWLESLVADLPGLQRVDLDQFLHADMIGGSSLIG